MYTLGGVPLSGLRGGFGFSSTANFSRSTSLREFAEASGTSGGG